MLKYVILQNRSENMCNCNFKGLYTGNDASLFEHEYLSEIKVDANSWKTLYRCKKCNTYWEETYVEGRFGGSPELRKVDESYVSTVWGL